MQINVLSMRYPRSKHLDEQYDLKDRSHHVCQPVHVDARQADRGRLAEDTSNKQVLSLEWASQAAQMLSSSHWCPHTICSIRVAMYGQRT